MKSLSARQTAWLASVAALGGFLLLYAYSPHDSAFYPSCVSHRLTGLYCPGCGGSRALHALLHGRLGAALGGNALVVILLPFAAACCAFQVISAVRRDRWKTLPVPSGVIFTVLLVSEVFALLRNIPFSPFSVLAP